MRRRRIVPKAEIIREVMFGLREKKEELENLYGHLDAQGILYTGSYLLNLFYVVDFDGGSLKNPPRGFPPGATGYYCLEKQLKYSNKNFCIHVWYHKTKVVSFSYEKELIERRRFMF